MTEHNNSLLLTSLIDQNALNNPLKVALIEKDINISYRELYDRSLIISRFFESKKFAPSSVVGVYINNRVEQIITVIGLVRVGLAYLAIDPDFPQELVINILNQALAEMVVVDREMDKKLTSLEKGKKVNFSEVTEVISQKKIFNALDPSTLAYVIFTSGSTGRPKGVMITHEGAMNTILDINNRFNINENDIILAVSSLSFDLSVYDIFGILSAGGTVIVPSKEEIRDPEALYNLINTKDVTIWNSVPMLMDMLVDYISIRKGHLGSIQLIMLSGDWIPLQLPQKLREYSTNADLQLISLGGATEASIWSVFFKIKDIDQSWNSIPYGKPLSNQSIYVMDYELNICPTWAVGELYIGGKGVAYGYINDAEKTKQSFITHPVTEEKLYRTGDWGKYLPDGNIEFIGRKDFQVKIRGYRVELSEIETIMLSFPTVKRVVVIPINNRNNLAAFLITTSNSTLNKNELKEFLHTKLPTYMIPSEFICLEKFPLNNTGKIDRKKLDTFLKCEKSETVITDNGDDELIQEIRNVICNVIQIESLALDANLLEKGINSIEVVRIANELEKKFGYRPPLRSFYSEPTVNAIAKIYRENIKIFPESNKNIGEQISSASSYSGELLFGEKKEEFKKSQINLRKELADKSHIDLGNNISAEEKKLYIKHKSHRNFLPLELSLERFSSFISCLKCIQLEEGPKYLYPSAGGLYPVQIYLHIKSKAISGVQEGAYYYDPTLNRLIFLSNGNTPINQIHDPLINRRIAEESSFAIFLVAKKNAITPVYGEISRDFCLLESGYVGMLLMSTAVKESIGLCPIGEVNFDVLKDLFLLDEDHELMHMLVGGPIKHTNSFADIAAEYKSNPSLQYEKGEI